MSLKVIGAGHARHPIAKDGPWNSWAWGPLLPHGRGSYIEITFPAGSLPTEGGNGSSDLFSGYAATVDWPSCNLWQAQLEAFPEAKILLSKPGLQRPGTAPS